MGPGKVTTTVGGWMTAVESPQRRKQGWVQLVASGWGLQEEGRHRS